MVTSKAEAVQHRRLARNRGKEKEEEIEPGEENARRRRKIVEAASATEREFARKREEGEANAIRQRQFRLKQVEEEHDSRETRRLLDNRFGVTREEVTIKKGAIQAQ